MSAALLAAVAAGGAADDDAWTEVRTPNFQVVSNAGGRTARRAVLRLERFRSAAGHIFEGAPLDDDVPMTVLLFRNARSMRPFLPAREGRASALAGMFLRGHDRNYMAIDAGAERDVYSTLFHEYVHVLNSRATPALPLWMDEGLAEVYGTADVDDDRVVIGAPVAGHLEVLRTSRPLPLDELLAATPSSPHYAEGEGSRLFHAQSWALVHYLLLGSSGHARPLRAYLAARAKGLTAAAAVHEAWGRDLAALQKELTRYVRGASYVGVRVPVPPLPSTNVRESALSRAESEYYLGDFLAHDRRVEDARPHLQRAIMLDPARAEPYRSLGLGHYLLKEHAEALRWLAAAAERDPRDGVARYFRARAMMEQAGGHVGPALAAAVREDLRVAVERAPALKDARDLLAQVERVLASGNGHRR